ncbi:transcription initiation protein [Kribbella qitaiheensis]|uniref:Transcription initiation protein n=1 Tax=Kribbella qitaiheensis TaxID=1544730 RepID=A0A7G6WV07_9ACTN|nr:YciI family protein [Kribbella qitaiheensis]QNE17822.1 transcription initiation protein [Kribbella qitaiheensis]
MKYLLMICGDESAAAYADAGCGGWSEEMAERGVLEGDGVGLRPPHEATTVRVRDDELRITDGPFAETKEQIGGFVLISCADLDEAIEIAAKHPAAKYGTIEIRPVFGPPSEPVSVTSSESVSVPSGAPGSVPSGEPVSVAPGESGA